MHRQCRFRNFNLNCAMSSIVILGPAYPLRGGIAAFNERLAVELQRMGHRVVLYTFSLQYPAILFPGKTQYTDTPPPDRLDIRVTINSINPLSWWLTGREIKNIRPDLVVTRFWIPFMAPSLGSILRRVRRNNHTRIVCIADNIIPHEKRPGDQVLTRYFTRACDAFIAMSKPVVKDLKKITPKPVSLVPHPLYDQFGERVDQRTARRHLHLPEEGRILLFFGFIRKYKGLDILLEALGSPALKAQNIRLLIAGEFYEKKEPYEQLLQKYGLQESVFLHHHYIADEAVKYYFCAADAVVLPYRSATQSGIAPMAYHFERPMIATRVGGLPDTIRPGETGLLCEADPASLAEAINRFYITEDTPFLPYLRREKQKYSWKNMAEAVLASGDLKPAAAEINPDPLPGKK